MSIYTKLRMMRSAVMLVIMTFAVIEAYLAFSKSVPVSILTLWKIIGCNAMILLLLYFATRYLVKPYSWTTARRNRQVIRAARREEKRLKSIEADPLVEPKIERTENKIERKHAIATSVIAVVLFVSSSILMIEYIIIHPEIVDAETRREVLTDFNTLVYFAPLLSYFFFLHFVSDAMYNSDYSNEWYRYFKRRNRIEMRKFNEARARRWKSSRSEERRAFAEIKVKQRRERKQIKTGRDSRRILTSRSSTP